MKRIAFLLAVAGLTRAVDLRADEPAEVKPLEIQLQQVAPGQFRIEATGKAQALGQPAENPSILVRKPGERGEGVIVINEEEAPQGEYWIGLEVAPLPANHKPLAGSPQLPENFGLAVEEVMPDSPAAKAGLKSDDVLLYAAGKPLKERGDLIAAIQAAKDTDLAIGLVRDGKTMKLAVKPARRTALEYNPFKPRQNPAPSGEAQEQAEPQQRLARRYLEYAVKSSQRDGGESTRQQVASLLQARKQLQGQAHAIHEQLEALGDEAKGEKGRKLNGQAHAIEEQLEALLGVAAGLLGVLAGGDVARDRHAADDLPPAAAQRADLDLVAAGVVGRPDLKRAGLPVQSGAVQRLVGLPTVAHEHLLRGHPLDLDGAQPLVL